LKAGPRKEQIAQAQARLDVQTEQVNLLEDRRKKYTLKSPFVGYVVREYTEVGAWVKQGDPIAEVVNIDPVEIEVSVPEGTIRFLRRGLDVIVRVDAIGGKVLPGTISQIVPEADQRARTFPVRVRVANKPESEELLIRPGMLAKVTLPTSDPVDGLTISKDAAVFRGESATIYKAVDGKAVPVPIKIIASFRDRYLVESEGLDVDDVVVNRGNERVRPGQPLLIQDINEAE
jgi:HlyD family secretion protein